MNLKETAASVAALIGCLLIAAEFVALAVMLAPR